MQSSSLAAILPLAAGRAGWEALRNTRHQSLFHKGIALALEPEAVAYGDQALRERFISEFEALN